MSDAPQKAATPRTDAEILTWTQLPLPNEMPPCVTAHFARTLEWELALAKAGLACANAGNTGLSEIITALRAERDALAVRLKMDADYIKAMDSVIDEHRIARSCINPLEDLKRGIAGIVQERDALAKERDGLATAVDAVVAADKMRCAIGPRDNDRPANIAMVAAYELCAAARSSGGKGGGA